MTTSKLRVFGLAAALIAIAPSESGPRKDWPFYGGDPGQTKHSALAQINKKNVAQLKPVWIFETPDWSDGKKFPGRSAFEATPLMVDGTLYVVTPFHRVFALDAETGAIKWEFDSQFDRSTRVTLYQSRGLAFWRTGSTKRILMNDQQGRLFSIDVATGKLDKAFGESGIVDLRPGITDEYPRTMYGQTSPPAICGNVAVVGAAVGDGEPRGPAGDVRGFDVRTGRELWRFHTVPRPGEIGNETWTGQSWKSRSGVNVWSLMSVDPKRNTVFLPLTSPATDFYGGDRAGNNLFGDSVVALDCSTGKRKWHFQTVHHNLWDYDLPSAPVLTTVRHGGKNVDSVAQITKTGFVFLLDRDSGKPLFEVQERPVPASTIPGEKSSPTQPYPVKPPPFARQSMRWEDMTDVTPESRAECMAMVEDAVVNTKLYDPIGDKLTVMFPGTNGGSNWGGGSFDPSSGLLYVNSMDVAAFLRLVKRPNDAEIPYRNQSFDRFWDKANRYPCQKPPWGTLTAIDLNKGELRWQVRLGEFDELTKRGVPKTGTPNLGGSIVTAGGLIFIGATNDSKFRAFDKDTGSELWVTRLPASAHATPMTYIGPKSGRQFVVVAAGGGNKYNTKFVSQLVAFALPKNGTPEEPHLISAAPGKLRPLFRAGYRGAEEKLPAAAPEQPLPFSHRAHANLKLKCAKCHATAATEARASLPPIGACMACHRTVRADSQHIAELKKRHDRGVEIPWQRVYRLPDFVSFSHARHTSAQIVCATCHGPVEQRDVLAKEVSTSMVACMQCHTSSKASNACTTCHDLGQ